jgi:hypothetical protein
MIDKLENKAMRVDFGKGKPPVERGACPRCGAKINGTAEIVHDGTRGRVTMDLHCEACNWASASEASAPHG